MRAITERISLSQKNGRENSIEYILDADEEINAFSHGMMTHNNIGGIIGYVYELTGGVHRLCFNQPNGIQFSLLLTQSLRRQTLLGILSGIADVIARAEEYMLDEGGFVLSPEYIYINTATLDVEMLYIPTTGTDFGKPYWLFVKDLLFSVIVSTDEDTSYIQQIVNFINSAQSVSSDKLGALIKSLLSDTKTPSAIYTAPPVRTVSVSAPAAEKPSPQPIQTAAAQSAGVKPETPKPPVMPQPAVSEAPAKRQPFWKKKKEEKPSKPKKEPKQPNNSFGFNIPGQQPAPVMQSVPAAEPQPAPSPSYSAQPAQVSAPASETEDYNAMTVFMGDEGQADGSFQPCLERRSGERIFINKNMFFIGKADKGEIANDYIVKNSAVSRNHAFLRVLGNTVTITDNGSLNGTFVNDERLPRSAARELHNGDVIRLADEQFVYRIM